jgi:hypothetical protein
MAAAILCLSIAPWTTYVMVPTNFRLIKMNEDLGGARSSNAAKESEANFKPGQRSAEESVNSVGEGNQYTDLSGPMGKTSLDSSAEEDRKAQELLGKFGRLNTWRAAFIGLGGMVGLWAAVVFP